MAVFRLNFRLADALLARAMQLKLTMTETSAASANGTPVTSAGDTSPLPANEFTLIAHNVGKDLNLTIQRIQSLTAKAHSCSKLEEAAQFWPDLFEGAGITCKLLIGIAAKLDAARNVRLRVSTALTSPLAERKLPNALSLRCNFQKKPNRLVSKLVISAGRRIPSTSSRIAAMTTTNYGNACQPSGPDTRDPDGAEDSRSRN